MNHRLIYIHEPVSASMRAAFPPDTAVHRLEKRSAAFATPLFRDPDIRDRILKSGKDFGIFSVGKKGKKTVYSFARLKILDMYYVVVADHGKLLAHVGKLDR